MINAEPPAEHWVPPRFLVGRDRHGQWLVRKAGSNQHVTFNNRTDALRFAFCERGEAAGAVVLASDMLESIEASASDTFDRSAP